MIPKLRRPQNANQNSMIGSVRNSQQHPSAQGGLPPLPNMAPQQQMDYGQPS
jgi:hypothetical protein